MTGYTPGFFHGVSHGFSLPILRWISLKRLLYLVLAALVLVGTGLAWRHYSKPLPEKPAAKGPSRPLPVKTAQVVAGPVVDGVSAVGTLLASESVMIRPEVDGRIVAIHFLEGQRVRKGERLLTMDAGETEAQLASAVAAANLNRSRLRRAEDLQARNFISVQALDEAREQLNQASARETELRAKLAKTVVHAPFEGITGLRQVSAGAYVRAGQDVARLEGIGVLKLDFRVPELYLKRLRVGQALAISVDAYAGEAFAGSIYAIEPAVDESTRTVLLRARLPNPGARLKPGMFARVSLEFGRRDSALLVPEQAIVPRSDGRFVFRVVEGRAQLTRIETGVRRPGEVEVLAGLQAGDTIVADGQLRLQDGAAVSVGPPKPAPAATPGTR
jgi:membrane fusion protein (multidrug efflux system)